MRVADLRLLNRIYQQVLLYADWHLLGVLLGTFTGWRDFKGAKKKGLSQPIKEINAHFS